MNTIHDDGFISGESFTDDNICLLASGEYDLMFLASSWDARCIEICSVNNAKVGNSCLLLFDQRDHQGLREKHDNKLNQYIADISINARIIRGKSTDLETVWNQLSNYLHDSFKKLKRPLKVILDLSSFPRFYALGLIAYGLLHGFVEQFVVIYSEASYGKPEDDREGFIFKPGKWREVPVPCLHGKYDPGKKTHYLVSVGFEGPKTLRAMSRTEADRVSILFPDPGYTPQYIHLTQESNKELLRRYKIPEDQILRAPAGDAIAAWKILSKSAIERPADENCHFILCGTKPHCLGLALRALCLNYPIVLYSVPEEHKPVNISASGRYWRFDIRDLSSIPQ